MIRVRAIIALWLAFCAGASAQVIFLHTGATDPTSEGWTQIRSGSGLQNAPVVDDRGNGIDAWSIKDDSVGPDSLIYKQDISPEQQDSIVTNGWRLTVLVRVIDLPTTPNGSDPDNNSIVLKVRTGLNTPKFDLVIGYVISDGKASIKVNGIANWVDDYALIEVEYTPALGEFGKGEMTMHINGTSRWYYSNVFLDGDESRYLSWGASAGATFGHAHWAKVQFEILPALERPRLGAIEIYPVNQMFIKITNCKRGVYYRIEQSTNLVDWEMVGSMRATGSGIGGIMRPLEGEKYFYRFKIE